MTRPLQKGDLVTVIEIDSENKLFSYIGTIVYTPEQPGDNWHIEVTESVWRDDHFENVSHIHAINPISPRFHKIIGR